MLEGAIALAPAGDEGFGFDPIFVPLGETRTVAELGDEWKAQHSHRALAARPSRHNSAVAVTAVVRGDPRRDCFPPIRSRS